MTLNNNIPKSTPYKYRWSLLAVALMLVALGILVAYGFHISERPSTLNYPILSVVREIRYEAQQAQNHLTDTAGSEMRKHAPVSWQALEQAIWHLNIMLVDSAQEHAMSGHAGMLFRQPLADLKSKFDIYQQAVEDYLTGRKSRSEDPKPAELNRAFSHLIGVVDALETAMIHQLNNENRRFRLTIVGMTVFSLLMVVVAGLLMWRFEKQQIRIQEILKASKDRLEALVAKRTHMLSATNERLQSEITEHKKAEQRLLQYQKKLRRVTSELLQTQEKERRRIATEIHDRIGQALAVTKIQLGALQSMLDDPSRIAPVEEIRALITQTIQDTRSLTFELSPPVLYELGLQAALEWLAENIHGQSGLSVQVQGNPGDERLEIGHRVFLFKAVRELLYNVMKHADAKQAEIKIIHEPDRVEIEVRDHGKGCDSLAVESHEEGHDGGFGLFSIREQLRHYGGKLIFESELGRGTCASITMPLETAV